MTNLIWLPRNLITVYARILCTIVVHISLFAMFIYIKVSSYLEDNIPGDH